MENCELRKPESAVCARQGCYGCGFDITEAARRKELLNNCGLTVCKDGLKRLVIKRRAENG